MKEHIKEVIVVEGKNDTNVLQSYFDCDTIETSGDSTNPLVLERIKEAQRVRGVIVLQIQIGRENIFVAGSRTMCRASSMPLLLKIRQKQRKSWCRACK